jgi:phage baseplate assembly protein gpV
MSNDAIFGTQTPQVEGSDYNTIAFVIQQMLSKVNTCSVVQVVACTNSGGVSPVGTVDVQPLVNQMTGNRIAVPHLRVYKLPYVRLQGGANAVILDPQPGDIGIVVCSQRDITSVKASKAQANPGSFRMFNWADAIYIGGILNGTPTQYVAFAEAGVTVVSPSKVTIQAPAIELDGDVTVTGTTTGTGDGTFEGVSVKHHVHSGVTTGGSDTGPPV